MTKRLKMKKRFLLLPLLGLGLYFSLTSSSNGYNQNRTGSHGGTVGCGSCHGSSAVSGITVAVELDSAGTPVTRYKPGMTYTIKLTGTNTTSSTLPAFGMELSVVSGSGTSSANAGTLSGYPSTVSPATGSGSITYLTHNTPISPASGTGASGTTYVVTTTWTAPAAGTGTVTAYGLINAVNNNGNDDNGDKWNTANASFTELPASGVGVNNVAASDINVYPNPVSSVLNVTGVNGSVQVFDVNGKLISSVSVNNSATIDASGWANGLYFVSINNAGQVTNKTIVKQ